MVTLISLGNGFWVMNTWQAPVRKWLKRSTLNFAHTFLTTATQNRAHIFSNNELFIYFESVFSMKTVKGWIFKKIFRQKKSQAVLFVTWLTTYQWNKIMENCNTVGAFCWCLESIRANYIYWKRLMLVHKGDKCINSTVMYLTYFYFVWKGTLRP